MNLSDGKPAGKWKVYPRSPDTAPEHYCEIDWDNFCLRDSDKGLWKKVTTSRANVLRLLVSTPNQVHSFSSIYQAIHPAHDVPDDADYAPDEHSAVRKAISNLVKMSDVLQSCIKNQSGTGYRFVGTVQRETLNVDSEKARLCEMLFPVRLETAGSQPSPQDPAYIERKNVAALIDSLKDSCRIIEITGRPGTGKSMFLREFIRSCPDQILSSFFCRWDDEKKNDPVTLSKELSYQMLRNDTYCRRLSSSLNAVSKEALQMLPLLALWEYLFVNTLCGPDHNISGFIVIDALDECTDPKALAKLIGSLAPYLPSKITFLVSSRHSLFRSLSPSRYASVRIDAAENRDDVRQYLQNRLSGDEDGDIIRLADVCGANFMYAKFLCDDILSGREYPGSQLSRIENGLNHYYRRLFQQQFPDGYSSDQYRLLSVILALRAPAGLDLLCLIMGTNHSEMMGLIRSAVDVFSETDLPDRVAFYHKSICDWLLNSKQSQEYALSLKDGCRVIFDFIQRELASENEVPYPVFKDWDYYGKKADNSEFRRMFNDRDLLLETIREHRLHGELTRALSLASYDRGRYRHASPEWFWFSLAYSDVLFDLWDIDAAEKVMRELWDARDSVPGDDRWLRIYLYQNLAWLYMEQKKYNESALLYEEVLHMYEELPAEADKERQYSRYLYYYATTLYRSGQFEHSRQKIEEAIQIAGYLQNTDSLEYSLMLKILAWNLQQFGQYEEAGAIFEEALQIQLEVFKNQPGCRIGTDGEEEVIPLSPYIAHTCRSLAENDLKLFDQKRDKDVIEQGLKCIETAAAIYGRYEDIRFKRERSACKSIRERFVSMLSACL